ncbi:MAG: hypothetical protein HQL51_06915 [Magnetococcales bacterium]|nr:hypothetical protein [Magnetococcales bacterium]
MNDDFDDLFADEPATSPTPEAPPEPATTTTPRTDADVVEASLEALRAPGMGLAPAASPPGPDEPWKILVVDDEKAIHQVTLLALKNVVFQNRKVQFFHAYSRREAEEILTLTPGIALILLDVVMETQDAGLQFARWVRESAGERNTRIVLRTGQPGHAPEKSVIQDYDINDYKEKTELTDIRLYTTVVAALRNYRDLLNVAEGVRRITAYSQAAEQFVPMRFLQRLGRKSLMDVRLGDYVHRNMTVFFSDMRDFSSLTERMTPLENLRFLNSYLKQIEPPITEHGGFIDKFLGDGCMALFDTAEQAVAASGLILHRLKAYNQGRGRAGYDPIRIGIGLHSGGLALGAVGSAVRMDGTAVGDAVNLAARIEALTKPLELPLLLSGSSFFQLSRAQRRKGRLVAWLPVKGRTIPTPIYAWQDEAIPEWNVGLGECSPFPLALLRIQQGRWDRAARLLHDCRKRFPDDPIFARQERICAEKIASRTDREEAALSQPPRWRPEYRSGDAAIDDRYAALIHWLAQGWSELPDVGVAVWAQTFQELLRTRILPGFREEEERMAATNVPDLADHRLEHDAFAAFCREMDHELRDPQRGMEAFLFTFSMVSEWILAHPAKRDRKWTQATPS